MPPKRPRSPPGPGEKYCSKCRRNKAVERFPLKQKGNATGSARTAHCFSCTTPRSNEKENDDPSASPADSCQQHEAVAEPLPPLAVEDLLDLLSEDDGNIQLEACVDTTDIAKRVDHQQRAVGDELARLIWDRTHYRFRYHSFYSLQSSAVRFMYSCAQNATRAHKPEKHADEDKQRDKISLDTFKCDGWMHIIVAADANTAVLKLQHVKDHVHYQSVNLPPDVLELIESSGSLTVSQIWQQVLQKHPMPAFTRKAVYNVWAQRDSAKWKRHEDPLKSAEILLEEGKRSGAMGMYQIERIAVSEPGFEALAWSLPDVLVQWGGRLREVALDSAWETNGQRTELYALLGEGYGSGLPLGFLLLRNVDGAPGGIQSCLEQFIDHFALKLTALQFSHSDKYLPEINAFRTKIRDAKHQLCFWHSLRAVKKRLSLLRRQPAHYNVDAAQAEFRWISPAFLPISQRDGNTPPIPVATQTIPTITVRLNGKLVARPTPKFIIRIPARGAPGRTSTPPRSPSAADAEDESDSGDEAEGEGDDGVVDDEDPVFADQLKRALKDVEDETDDEDGPDWLFEAGETRSKDPGYVFCPAEHRRQLLRLFTRHFVQHPLLPEPDQPEHTVRTATEIRMRAVKDMYDFCYQRGLTEVWAYMWTSWYSQKMWPLWALSAGTRIPRLRTTMTVENFWKQLKHDWLHHLTRPRLDQLVWIICTELLPVYMQRAAKLENTHRLGRSKELNSFQKYFKREWKRLAKVPLTTGRAYTTSIKTWQCNCGAQKYSAYLLCKHLVQAVPKPSAKFWMQIHRRRTIPFYRHPELRRIGEPVGAYGDPDDDPLSDGDDQVWTGNPDDLKGGGRWREMLEGRTGQELHLKRKRSDTPSTWNDDASAYSDAYEAADVDGVDVEHAVEEEHDMRERLRKRARSLSFVASAINAHLDNVPHETARLWLRQMDGMKFLDDVDALAEDLQTKENGRARHTTWARNGKAAERRLVQNTMGYQVGLLDDE